MQIALILKLTLMCWYADICRYAKVLFTFENLNIKMEIMLKFNVNYFNIVDRSKLGLQYDLYSSILRP